MNTSHTLTGVALALALAMASNVTLATDKCGSGKCGMDGHGDKKSMAVPQQNVKMTNVDVRLPNVVQLRADGSKVKFADAIDDGRPVMLNFIFTTCKAICPISSSTFMQLQNKLGKENDRLHLVSVSIDPEQDTPARLRDYATRYHAAAGWDYYTGTADASIAIQSAFNVYRGDKMSHDPVTFVRIAPGKPWLRIDGFTSADVLLNSYHKQLAANN